uniref:Ig-like domain-containing protein n=1 Tax=Anas zonorhyncha TaxID=75864 RepID=A0A8B9ZQP9_9AVES
LLSISPYSDYTFKCRKIIPYCKNTTLFLTPAQLRVVGPRHPVSATVGQDVVLPCHLSPQRDARTLDVRWIRKEFSETVHHYRNGEDLYGEQMGAYVRRTELVRDGLSAGRLDLRIMGLTPSDDGLYVCTVEDAHAYKEAIVDLEVSESQSPLSSRTSALLLLSVLGETCDVACKSQGFITQHELVQRRCLEVLEHSTCIFCMIWGHWHCAALLSGF